MKRNLLRQGLGHLSEKPLWKNPVWKNPVVIKDIRTRMRGNRAFIVVTIHLVVLALVTSLAYLTVGSSLGSNTTLEQRRVLGKSIFGLLIWLELVTISFVAPALTSGAISTERERQTFDLLRVTLLPARSLVLGKYIAGLVFILLLLFTSIPLQGPAFLVGGVLPEEIIIATLILLVTALAFCGFGMFVSSLVSRTLLSSVLAYAYAILLVFGLPMIFLIILLLSSSTLENLDQLGTSAQALLLSIAWFFISLTPLATIIATEYFLLDQHAIWMVNIPLNSGLSVRLPSPWILYVCISLGFTILMLWGSIRLVRRGET
jgi:ABC-2 type transport system permease protein